MTSGELAAQRMRISGFSWPLSKGSVMYSGGLRGSGDQAAALASMALVRKSAAAMPASSWTLAAFSSQSMGGFGFASRQHGLIAYTLEKIPGALRASRRVP